MTKCYLLLGCVVLSSCTQSVVELEPKYSQPVTQEANGFVCYTDIVLSDNRSRTLTYGKNMSTQAVLAWLQSAIQTVTKNQVNFVDAAFNNDPALADDPILEISLDFAYVSHAATNKIGVVAFTASKAGQQARFRGNSSNVNWASTKAELAAALNRAVSKALTKLAENGAFCNVRPAVWRDSDLSISDLRR